MAKNPETFADRGFKVYTPHGEQYPEGVKDPNSEGEKGQNNWSSVRSRQSEPKDGKITISKDDLEDLLRKVTQVAKGDVKEEMIIVGGK